MADTSERFKELSDRVEKGFQDLREFTRLSDRVASLEDKIDAQQSDIAGLKESVDELSSQLEPLADVVGRLEEIRDKLS